jgi:hypothetical protein
VSHRPHEIAASLYEDAIKIGLDAPTESMIADRILDVICNVLNDPIGTVMEVPDGNADCKAMQMARALKEADRACGDLADNAALDMDHDCKRHPQWYGSVKRYRELRKKCLP